MKRESIDRVIEICNKLRDLESSLKELNEVEKELDKVLEDDFYLKFYLTFHTYSSNMIGISKQNIYVLKMIQGEIQSIKYDIEYLTKELETL